MNSSTMINRDMVLEFIYEATVHRVQKHSHQIDSVFLA